MRLFELFEGKDRNRRNKMIFFRQTIDSLLDKIRGKTIVVFDTETTGFSVLQPWIQVTEIAAVAIDADTGKEISRFHKKVKLKPEVKSEIDIQKKNQKDGDRGAIEGPRGLAIQDLFKMTKYGEKNAPFEDIKQVYQSWADWLNELDSPIMLGQNAAFDMAHMFAPMKKLGVQRPKIGEVLDTMIFARTWIYPLLSAAAESGDEEAAKMVAGFTNPKTGKLTFSLGPMGKALGVTGKHWHSGISDAMQTYGIFLKMLEILRKSKESGLDKSDTFNKLHAQMSQKAFSYGKRPAFQATVKSDTAKGIAARGHERVKEDSNQSAPQIFVDMDGVLVDTYTEIAALLGAAHYDKITPDQWEKFYSKTDGYRLFRNLPIAPDARQLISLVKGYAKGFSILSTPLNYDVEGSIKGKDEWLRKYNISPDAVIFEADKQKYATSNGVPNILIDDSDSQLRKWAAAGGIAIKYICDKHDIREVKTALDQAFNRENTKTV